MKKLLVVLIAALSVVFTGCSAFDSEQVEPNIIGSGNLQYEEKSDTWFVCINSTQYTITNVTIPDHNPRAFNKTQKIAPVEGMLVTVFTSPRKTGMQAVTGKQSAEQIEELYHTNSFGVLIICGLLAVCIIGMAAPQKTEKIPVVNADV